MRSPLCVLKYDRSYRNITASPKLNKNLPRSHIAASLKEALGIYLTVPSGLDGSLQYRVILLEQSTDRGLRLSISGGWGSAEPWGTSFAHWRRARLKGANGKQLRSFRAGIQPNSDYALAQASTALHVCVFVFLYGRYSSEAALPPKSGNDAWGDTGLQ